MTTNQRRGPMCSPRRGRASFARQRTKTGMCLWESAGLARVGCVQWSVRGAKRCATVPLAAAGGEPGELRGRQPTKTSFAGPTRNTRGVQGAQTRENAVTFCRLPSVSCAAFRSLANRSIRPPWLDPRLCSASARYGTASHAGWLSTARSTMPRA
jgi:hypothetical protein